MTTRDRLREELRAYIPHELAIETFDPYGWRWVHASIVDDGTDTQQNAVLTAGEYFIATALQLNADSGGLFLLLLQDENRGYPLTDDQFPTLSLCTNGPFVLPQPWVIAPKTRVSAACKNVSGSTDTLRGVLWGYKVYVNRGG